MRTSTLLTAAFAGAVMSSPLRRDVDVEVDTVYDVVYVTAYATETATAEAPAVTTTVAPAVTTTIAPSVEEAPVVESSSTSVSVEQKGLWQGIHSYSWAWTTSVVYSESAPEPTTSSIPVVESTSVYVAPSTSVYVAPSSYAAPATSSAVETSSAAPAKATTYQQRVIAHHNVHRSNHSAPNLAWDQGLADTAQKIAESCVYAHNVNQDGGGYGQNIAAGVPPANVSAVITDLFYNGEVNYFNNLYGQANPDMSSFEKWGHFSQIVWKSTTKVGCATVDCSAKGLANTGQYVSPFFTVCNYGPPGNYGGEYADNIGKSLNRASVGWNYGL